MKKHFCLKCGKELDENQLICPKCNHCSYFDFLENSDKTVSSVLTAQQIELNTQWVKYRCGKNGSTGHGFAAEDANALDDILWGNHVEFSGRDNRKNGPDRICNGVKIQQKYYANAKSTVEAAFCKETGMYAYKDQVLEVPADQYDEALRFMHEKIQAGLVEGFSDPNDAKKIVKKGVVTYRQSRNIAKSGNIDSIIFDAKTQSISALSAFGISFAISLGLNILQSKTKKNVKEFMQLSFLSGLQNGTITMASGILTSQVLKTQFGRNMAAAIQWKAKAGVDYIYKSATGKKIIHKMAEAIFKKNLKGAVAKNVAVKFLRTNVITNLSLIVVSTVPDVFRVVANKISRPQFIKNLLVSSSSVFAGTVGMLAGMTVGGPVGGMALGVLGSTTSGWLTKKVADKIAKDDADRMYELIKVALIQLSNDFLIQNENEFQKCIDLIAEEKAINSDLIKSMFCIGADGNDDFVRVELAYRMLEYYFSVVIRSRKKVCLMQAQEMLLDSIDDLGKEIPNILLINNDNDKKLVI